MRTAVDIEGRDLGWYYTTATQEIGAGTDPTKMAQGQVCVSLGDNISADGGLLAGYLCFEYHCEFDDPRPARDVSILLQADPEFTVAAGAAADIPFVSWLGGLGDFGWEDSKAAAGAGLSAKDKMLYWDVGQKFLEYALSWTSATSDEQKSARAGPHKVYSVRRSSIEGGWGAYFGPQWRWRIYLDGGELNELPAGCRVTHTESHPCECVAGGLVRVSCRHPWWWTDEKFSFRFPEAAGDIIIVVNATSAQTDATTALDTTTFSLGTGAVVTTLALNFTTASSEAPVRVRVNVDSAGTETRSINNSESMLGCQTVIA
jgi:hypothetical protein